MGLWYGENKKQALVKQFSIFTSNFSNLHKHLSKGTDLDQSSPCCENSPATTTMVGLMPLLNLQTEKHFTISKNQPIVH